VSWGKTASNVLGACAVLALSVVVFDALAYFLVPDDWVSFVPYYRSTLQNQNLPTHARGYPRGYFRADDELGFDIQENVRGATHVFPEASIHIFSNDIGCFDRNSLEDLRQSTSFDYFAGDSQTWGYASYEKKFPTVYEAETGRTTAKCGVTHTGQLHQFAKFKKIVRSIGRYPDRVFVGYVGNDPSNDFAHPHSTVIHGFQVDTVEVDGTTLVPRDMSEIESKISKWLETSPESETPLERIKDLLKRWSLTANLIYVAKQRFVSARREGPQPLYSLDGEYDFEQTYMSNDVTARNREAIRKWSKDAKEHSYRLTFLLFPPKHSFDDTEHFSGLRDFLTGLGVEFIDFTEVFAASGKTAASFYWPVDGHFNHEGNVFVGEYLSKQ
jgi:hypothetical protein